MIDQRVIAKLGEAGLDGVDIAILRCDERTGRYKATMVRLRRKPDEAPRLGIRYDIGFVVDSVRAGSVSATLGIAPGDFLPKIGQTFVHAEADLDLLRGGNRETVRMIRWSIEGRKFIEAGAPVADANMP